jgi:nucleoid-associated protein YejK
MPKNASLVWHKKKRVFSFSKNGAQNGTEMDIEKKTDTIKTYSTLGFYDCFST